MSLLITYGMGRNLMLNKPFDVVLKYTEGNNFKLAWGMTGIFINIRLRVLETWEETRKKTASSSRVVQHLSMPCNLR